MRSNKKRDMVRRPAPKPLRESTEDAFNTVLRECQGTGPKVKRRAARRPR
jgi:hypothetical protein